jgi:hypothetical protein
MAGETTSVAASAARLAYENPGAGAFLAVFSLTFGTTDNELNDIMQAGYIPANTRVTNVVFGPTDMDTNGSPAVVHKVTINAVDAVTGLTGAQSGTSSSNVPTSTFLSTTPGTSPQLVQVQTTTAAATAAAGTATLILTCQKI